MLHITNNLKFILILPPFFSLKTELKAIMKLFPAYLLARINLVIVLENSLCLVSIKLRGGQSGEDLLKS